MRFELGKLELFGLDLSSLWQRWWSGINGLLPVSLADIFLQPAPRVQVSIDTGRKALTFVALEPGQPSRQILTMDFSDFGVLDNNSLHEQLTLGANKKLLQLDIALPQEQVLRRRLRVPAAARGNLRQVVGYQISRLTPFTAEQALYDVLVLAVDPATGMLDVELVLVSRAFAQPWLEQIERVTGMQVARLQAPVEQDEQVNISNLLEQSRAPSTWFRRFNRNSLLALLLLFSLGMAMVAPVVKLRYLVMQSKQEIAALDQRVSESRAAWYRLQHDAEILSFLMEQREQRGQPAMMLEELSRLIPDTVFLHSLLLEKTRVEIAGEGKQVVDLVEVLNTSELFEQARFNTAVTRNRDNLDVFTIGMNLAARGEQP